MKADSSQDENLHVQDTCEIISSSVQPPLTDCLKETFGNCIMLAASLSHDLKIPIQSEISAIDMIRKGCFGDKISDERNQRMLSAVYCNSRFKLELVQNLLDMLRFEIKKEKFNPEPLNLNDFLCQLCNELSPLVVNREHRLRVYSFLNEEHSVMADSTGLRRVLYNLVHNAASNLGNDGHIDLEVHARERDFLFVVRDNGPGIPLEVQDKLFLKFNGQRGDRNTSLNSGLGLYISRKIVNLHGGNIWVESLPGKGSTFCFTLPL